MSSIVTKRAAAGTFLLLINSIGFAREVPPRILQEPVLGLRYVQAKAELEVLPENVRALCRELADDDRWKGHLWIYARVDASATTYYVVGGYFERRKPEAGESRYELDERGGVIGINGTHCTAFGPAREVFDVRAFNEIPQPVFRSLATDFSTRLARALGGQEKLRRDLKNQRVDVGRLPQELHDAFSP
jgi:hypothetical protein